MFKTSLLTVIRPSVLAVSLALAACQGVNQKVNQYDAAADKLVVDHVDNSQVNQSINRGLDSAGQAVTSVLPGVLRPPQERLTADDSESAGESPEPLRPGGTAETLTESQPAVFSKTSTPELAAAPVVAEQKAPDLGLTEMRAAGVTLKRSNIRIGPGLDHDIIDTVPAGTPLTVSGRTANDWLLIDRRGAAFGYVSATLLRLAD